MIEIEIDGKKFQVEPGKMIIEVADEAGVRIPRFCYHKKLSIAANCRMCLVDVEKAPKPLPACATPVSDGMVVKTRSAKALDAQKAVMEFLLINHPLDCPICDQGGECELQDVAMGYGKDISRYTEGKRSVKDKNIGSLVATDMTRCIHCTRCVRFGDEILGIPQLGTIGRGEKMEISTYVEKSLNSEMSGNIIDLCPVGALTSKPFRFQARAWEMEQETSFAPHDCVGSNLYLHKLRQKILRVAPRDNEGINETWISDRDRFSYEGLTHEDRLAEPLVKKNGQWQETDWQDALNIAADGISKLVNSYGGQKLGAVISPTSTTEEMFLLQKLMRELGSQNIDHRLRITDINDQKHIGAHLGMGFSIDSIEEQSSILLIGSHINHEQPIIAHRIRKAFLQGSSIFAINAADYQFGFKLADKIIDKPSAIPCALAGVVKVLLEKYDHPEPELTAFLADLPITDEVKNFAEKLSNFEKGCIFLGEIAQNHPHASCIRYFAELIGKMTNAQVATLTPGANSAGAWLSGAIPHRTTAQKTVVNPGLSVKQMFDAKLPGYILFNVEPELDCTAGQQALDTLREAPLVVAITPYVTETIKSYADVILPIVPFSETSGTFINTEGKWQSFKGAVKPYGQARPGWKVIRVLGNLLELKGFDYTSSKAVYDEVKLAIDAMLSAYHKPLHLPNRMSLPGDELERLGAWPIYRSDSVVRRAESLQKNIVNESPKVWLNPHEAKKLNLTEGDTVVVKQLGQSVELELAIDDKLADRSVYIPAGFPETMALNDLFAPVTIVRS